MDRSEEMKRARLARQQHVLTWGGSGLTQAAYCRQHNLNATTFSGWLRHVCAGTARETQLGASGRAQAPLTALAVIVSAETDRHATIATCHEARERAVVTITGAGGWQISIDSDSSAPTMIQTLAALLVEIDHASTRATSQADTNLSLSRRR